MSSNRLTLQEGLKSSYMKKDAASNELAKRGYIMDKELSNNESRVYFKPEDNDLLVSYRGTTNLKDVGTDAYILFGGLKTTNRFKNSQKTLDAAKDKYKDANTTIIGHSLGGSLASAVKTDTSKDKVIGLDKGVGIFGNKSKSNEKAYRWSGDIISMLGKKQKTLGNYILNPLKAHDIDNLKKKKPIFL